MGKPPIIIINLFTFTTSSVLALLGVNCIGYQYSPSIGTCPFHALVFSSIVVSAAVHLLAPLMSLWNSKEWILVPSDEKLFLDVVWNTRIITSHGRT